MDYTISNNERLFSELLQVLNNHYKEPGVTQAFDNLKAAKLNYVNRSIDHMMNRLVLAGHYLVVHPPSEALQKDLRAVVEGFVAGIFEAASKYGELARQYEASGGELLSRDEILKEIDDRRGLAG